MLAEGHQDLLLLVEDGHLPEQLRVRLLGIGEVPEPVLNGLLVLADDQPEVVLGVNGLATTTGVAESVGVLLADLDSLQVGQDLVGDGGRQIGLRHQGSVFLSDERSVALSKTLLDVDCI